MEIQSPPEMWFLLNVARTFFMAITAYAVMKIVETYNGRQIYIHMHIYIYVVENQRCFFPSMKQQENGRVGQNEKKFLHLSS